MQRHNVSLETQKKKFIQIILKNPVIKDILDRGFVDEIPNWYLVAGCLNQTVWNYLTDKEVRSNINDYDLVYFDEDMSAQKEKDLENLMMKKYQKHNVKIDVKNQARVHMWIEGKMGLKIKPHKSCEGAIASWPCTVACVGVRKNNEKHTVYAPYGLTDSLEMIIRPNKTTVMRESDFWYKANKWKKVWPELTVINW